MSETPETATVEDALRAYRAAIEAEAIAPYVEALERAGQRQGELVAERDILLDAVEDALSSFNNDNVRPTTAVFQMADALQVAMSKRDALLAARPAVPEPAAVARLSLSDLARDEADGFVRRNPDYAGEDIEDAPAAPSPERRHRVSEPGTQSGRTLLAQIDPSKPHLHGTFEKAIFAIEQEAASAAVAPYVEWWRDVLADHEGHTLIVQGPDPGDGESPPMRGVVLCETDVESDPIEPPWLPAVPASPEVPRDE